MACMAASTGSVALWLSLDSSWDRFRAKGARPLEHCDDRLTVLYSSSPILTKVSQEKGEWDWGVCSPAVAAGLLRLGCIPPLGQQFLSGRPLHEVLPLGAPERASTPLRVYVGLGLAGKEKKPRN